MSLENIALKWIVYM